MVASLTQNFDARLGIAIETMDTSADGTFVDDYEYVAGAGDLDECNGMTVDGAYGYYVTDAYPWVLGCFRGTPDESFTKEAP